jgi:hypothetical protein
VIATIWFSASQQTFIPEYDHQTFLAGQPEISPDSREITQIKGATERLLTGCLKQKQRFPVTG